MLLERANAWVRTRVLAADAVFALLLTPLAGWTMVLLFDPASEAHLIQAFAVHQPWASCVAFAVVLAHLAIVGRRRWPFPSFLLVASATTVQLLTSIWLVLPSVVLILPSLYSYCAYGRRRASTVGLLISIGGCLVVTGLGFLLDGRPWQPRPITVHGLFRLLPGMIAAWSIGMVKHFRLAYLAELEQRARRAEADREERARRAVVDERARIAREMHDVVAHALSVVISQAQGGRYAARHDSGEAVRALTTIAETGRAALGDIRGLLSILRTAPGQPDQRESPGQPAMNDLPDLLDRIRAAGVLVEFTERGTPRRMSPAAELATFRLVQEALTNTIKHGGPSVRAGVTFAWRHDQLRIDVSDDGLGAVPGTDGHGLMGMRERLAVVGGAVSVGTSTAGGFRVEATVPTTGVTA